MAKAVVAILRTTPKTVVEDYQKLCELAGIDKALNNSAKTILKDNITWHHVFPGVNTTPWQLEGTILGLKNAGFDDLTAVHNHTVVTLPEKGEEELKFKPIYEKFNIPVLYNFKEEDMKELREKIEKKDLILELPEPGELEPVSLEERVLPESLRVAIRGVGGQGNLFFGRVLSEMALRTPYANAHIVKGDTHGMAQLGGPVISTFACGKVHSPVSAPNSADVLVVMEISEVLRPGFLDLLKPGGTIIMNTFRVVPAAVKVEDYPALGDIKEMLKDYHVITIDANEIASGIGDKAGRSANAVVLGLLSVIEPFNTIPIQVWLAALMVVSRRDVEKSFNYKAFKAGREYREEK